MRRDMRGIVVLVLHRRHKAGDVPVPCALLLLVPCERTPVVLVRIVVLVASVSGEVEMVRYPSDDHARICERRHLKNEHKLSLTSRMRLGESERIRQEFVCEHARPDARILLHQHGGAVRLRMVCDYKPLAEHVLLSINRIEEVRHAKRVVVAENGSRTPPKLYRGEFCQSVLHRNCIISKY